MMKLLRSSSSSISHTQIEQLLLEQKSASQLLDTFKWASSTLPCFTPSASIYRILIHKFCLFRRFDTAFHLLDQMPHSPPPHVSIFITLIRGSRSLEHARMLLHLLAKIHPDKPPPLSILNSILDLLVKHDIDVAREFYRNKMMACGVKGDHYTFAILMKGLCLTNRIGDGFKLLRAVEAPNAVVYNTMLHALCRNGKVGRARSLMSEMQNPNDITFNILISAYCGEENLVQALVMLEKCFGQGYVPDVVTVTKVLGLLCNAGRVTEAVKVLERVENNGGSVDVVAYNTLIKGFCKLGKAKIGVRIFKEMEGKGRLPNVDTYNVLISGFCESGMLDKAIDLFNDMKMDGVNWNFETYDALIRGLCSGGKTEDGLKILDLMNESKNGCRGRISPFNSVLYGMYKENRLDEALDFLASLGKLFPRAVDRSFRILGFCEDGDTENAKKVFDKMILERAVPCVLIYDYLIHRLCQQGSVREAFELMNEMIDHGYFPVASTFNVLINGFCRQGKVYSAVKLLEEMVGRDCLPNVGSYSHLISALCQKGDFQKALNLLFQMVQKGITPDLFTWISLLICASPETIWLNRKSMLYTNNQLDCIIKTLLDTRVNSCVSENS